jgi:methylthioribulose-1-phosphate dehydratase
MNQALLDTEIYRALRIDLVEIIHLFHSRGWSMATSTNYSFRNPMPDEQTYTISRSGVDKLKFSVNDFMLVDAQGRALSGYEHLRPSAETLLHTLIYGNNASVQCILHTHSKASTVFSLVHQKDKIVKLTGFELLKGLSGVQTHEAEVNIPVFDNSQDMKALAEEINVYYENNPNMLGFLLAGHGLYAWGNSVAEAKRHVESFEFLFECLLDMYKLCRMKPN